MMENDDDAKYFHHVVITMISFQLCTVLLGNAVQTSPSLRVKGWFYTYVPMHCLATIIIPSASTNTLGVAASQ